HAIPRRLCVSVTPQADIIIPGNLLQHSNVARIEINGALEGSRSLLVTSLLAPLNVARQLEYARIIGQSLARKFQFTQSAVIIEISMIDISRPYQVRFTSTRTQ